MKVRRPKREISERQLQALKVIHAAVEQNGYGPTYRDLARQLGNRSTNSVHELVDTLIRKGLVRRADSKARGFTLTGLGMLEVAGSGALIDPRFRFILGRRCQVCARVTFAAGRCPCGSSAFCVEAA